MDAERLRRLLDCFPSRTVLVAGDFFLDKYLEIDPRLSEPSLETGLEAYQVVAVRADPGAAGTVAANLRALEVGVIALGVIGPDGEGHDLFRALERLGADAASLLRAPGRHTPTYLKPLLRSGTGPARELNRLDTRDRVPLSPELEAEVIAELRRLVPHVQGVVISDQVPEANCGVITEGVRAALADLTRAYPAVVFAADSRHRVGTFRNVLVKPNAAEATRATGLADVWAAGRALRRGTGRPVVITHGEQGAFIFDSQGEQHVPAIPVAGPLDIVGAGDSAMAGLVAALCSGASLPEAATVGNLVASLTIQQLGTTGTATRAQVLSRFEEEHARSIYP